MILSADRRESSNDFAPLSYYYYYYYYCYYCYYCYYYYYYYCLSLFTCRGRVVVASLLRLIVTTIRRYVGASYDHHLGERDSRIK